MPPRAAKGAVQGVVRRIVFQNAQNGFVIASVDPAPLATPNTHAESSSSNSRSGQPATAPVTVIGTVRKSDGIAATAIAPGATLSFQGCWKNHPQVLLLPRWPICCCAAACALSRDATHQYSRADVCLLARNIHRHAFSMGSSSRSAVLHGQQESTSRRARQRRRRRRTPRRSQTPCLLP